MCLYEALNFFMILCTWFSSVTLLRDTIQALMSLWWPKNCTHSFLFLYLDMTLSYNKYSHIKPKNWMKIKTEYWKYFFSIIIFQKRSIAWHLVFWNIPPGNKKKNLVLFTTLSKVLFQTSFHISYSVTWNNSCSISIFQKTTTTTTKKIKKNNRLPDV